MLFNGLPFLKNVRSTSGAEPVRDRSGVRTGTSLFTARQLVQERLTISFELPTSPNADDASVHLGTNRVMMIG